MFVAVKSILFNDKNITKIILLAWDLGAVGLNAL